jgi:hypothetical protein
VNSFLGKSTLLAASSFCSASSFLFRKLVIDNPLPDFRFLSVRLVLVIGTSFVIGFSTSTLGSLTMFSVGIGSSI